MIKRYLFLAAWTLAAMTACATDYVVSGAGSTWVNGTYVETGTYGEKPLYIFGNYWLGYQNGKWKIADAEVFMMPVEMEFEMDMSQYYCESLSDLPPATGWVPSMGEYPGPTVGQPSPTLSYDGDTFTEAVADDGTIANTLVITYTTPGDDSFSGAVGVFDSAKYTVANVPDGLTVQITKNSGTELTVALLGTAVEHSAGNNVTNLTVAFLNTAFTLGDASKVLNATRSDFAIIFCSQDEFLVNTCTDNSQYQSSVAPLDCGGFVVAWKSDEESGYYTDIYAQRYDATGAAAGSEFRVNTYTNNEQSSPSVAALTNGGFVVAWSSYGQDGSGYGVYAQRYNAAGVATGSEFRVNTYTTSYQQYPSVTALAGGFVVAWQSLEQDGSSNGIYAQRYDATGAATGNEFRVNTYTYNSQGFPSVAALVTGGFVVAWESSGQDGSSYGIYAQRYDATGVATGNEFRVNTYTDSSQHYPSVAALVTGGFVVVWQSYGQDTSYDGIYAQCYDDVGTSVGSEFCVNTYKTSDQRFPSVAALAGGGFIVTWESDGQDGSGYGVYAQRYNAAGVATGSEFRVNTYKTSDQQYTSVAALATGGFVVAWQSLGQDGSVYGVYAGISTPLYTRGSGTPLEVNRNSGVTAIDALLCAYNLPHDELTWSVSSAPAHGSLAGFPATESGTAVLAPAGTSYQPSTDYAGTDSFTIAVTDGEAISAITVTVNVMETFTVSASAGPNGTVTPDGNVVFATGALPTNFVATADAYYHIDSFVTNGSAIAEAAGLGCYTCVWANVVADGTLTVDFAENLAANAVPECWLAQYGWTSDFDAAALTDTDNDGVSAWQEYVAGTDPTNAASKLSLAAPSLAFGSNYTETVYYREAGEFVRNNITNVWSGSWVTQRVYEVVGHVVSWPGVPGRVYDLECTTNLMSGTWDVLSGASGLSGISPANTITDAPPASTKFYRLKVRLP